MWIKSTSPTCRDLGSALLDVMSEHLKTERGLYEAAFGPEDPLSAYDANARAILLKEKDIELRSRIDVHRLTDHDRELPHIVEGMIT